MSAFAERPATPYHGPPVLREGATPREILEAYTWYDQRDYQVPNDIYRAKRELEAGGRRAIRARHDPDEDIPRRRPTQASPAICWDFTLWLPETFEGEFLESEEFLGLQKTLEEILDKYCQDWVYQLEQAGGSGEDGTDDSEDESDEGDLRFHLQGRFRLKTKARLTALKRYFKDGVLHTAHLSVTSSENRNNNFYVTKEDTRKGGPWYSESFSLMVKDDFVPRQVQEKMQKLFPWQQFVLDDCRKWCPRTINVIVDRKGNSGKSSFISYMLCKEKNSLEVPPVHDFKDVAQFICSSIQQKGRKYCKNIFVDFPRSRDQTKIHQFMAGIERIKDGRVFDCRYRASTVLIDSPNIWMFTNIVLKLDYVSYDRWAFWTIDKSKCLQPLDFGGLTKQEDLDNHVAYVQGLETKSEE